MVTQGHNKTVSEISDIIVRKLQPTVAPHVVALVLDYAKLWHTQTTSRREGHNNRMAVRAFSRKVTLSKVPFLESKPIAGIGRHPVRHIELVIIGRSQEWNLVESGEAGSWYILSKKTRGSSEYGSDGIVIARNKPGRKRYQVSSKRIDQVA